MYLHQGPRRKGSGASAAAAMPSRFADTEFDKLSEAEVWLRLQRLLEVAKQKQGNPYDNAASQQHPQQRMLLVYSHEALHVPARKHTRVQTSLCLQYHAHTSHHVITSVGGTPSVVCGMTGTSSAEDALAVSNTQLQVHKLMQEFALSRPGLLPGVLAPPGGGLLPLAAHAGPGPNEQLALVPVMIQNPDGSFTGAYQVQPYPSGFSTDNVSPELPGVKAPMPAVQLSLSSTH